jgi:arylsulfatase A-like enzyme
MSVWGGKKLVLGHYKTLLEVKIAILFCVLGATIFIIWLLRNKSELCMERLSRWTGIIQNSITPLVWLFGIIVVLSVPLVSYHTWFKGAGKKISKEIIQPSVADKNRPNIILVTFDAMTARNMSLYGYHRQTTPFISDWAKTATVFTKAEAESNFTAPTTASLMTGKRAWTHLRYSRMQSSKPIKTNIESLPLALKNNGYYNMALMVNIISTVNDLGIAGSFDIAPFPADFWVARNLVGIIHKNMTPIFSDKFKIHNWFFQEGFITAKFIDRLSSDFAETSFPPEKAFNKLISAIDHAEKPFFAWVHLNPPHGPYLPPKPYRGMFDQSGKMITIKSQLEDRGKIIEYLSLYKRFPADIEILKARYDEFVRYCDAQFEGFIEQLEKSGKLKNTIIILSTDHGEIFDHNSILHGSTLYEPETNIPLIIKEHGQSNGLIVDNLIEQIDIPATILDLAGISVPSWMEGRSLVPLMRGKKLSPRPAFSMNLEKNSSREQQITKGTIAVWDGDYKMIHDLEENKSMLFNLKKDPDELRDIFDQKTEVGQHLLTIIKDNLVKANEKIKQK